MFNKDWTTSSKFITYLALNREHDWETYVFNEENNKHALSIILSKLRKIRFSI